MTSHRWLQSLLCWQLVCLLCFAAPVHAANPRVARFAAKLANGELVAGEQLSGWDRADAELKLDDRGLLGEQPFVWLMDRERTPPPLQRPPHVEMWQGDILPGEIVGFVPQQSLPATPSHFLISSSALLQPPPTATKLPVRVDAAWVKRIVLQPASGEPLRPSQLRRRDGRVLGFRAARVTELGVTALTPSGRQSLRWSELAEICFANPWLEELGETAAIWQPHWLQRATLTPGGQGRLLELHTIDHLSVTASLARLAFPQGDKSDDPDVWVHGIHPVWSLDALWIPGRSVWLRLAYAPHQLPLSRLSPSEYEHEPLAGVWRPWRRDRNVMGESLLSAAGPAGWGIGAHSSSRLTFPVPPAARRLQGSAGLDISAGEGGCVVAKVLVNQRDAFVSEHLIGGKSTAFDVALAENPESLNHVTLEVDAAHANRPAGADPLDIRDQMNWTDLLLELDPEWVKSISRELAPRLVAPWDGWSVWTADEREWESQWDPLAAAPGGFVTRLKTSGAVVLARTLRRRPLQRYLVLSVSNADAQEPALLEVHSGGELLLSRSVPERSPRNPSSPLIVAPLQSLPLDEPRDLVVAIHAQEPLSLHWQAATLAAAHPEYTQLFDDEPHPQAIAGRDLAYTGPRAYRIAPDEPLRHVFRQPMAFRYRPDPGESRYLRFAVRSPDTAILACRVKTAGEERPFLYDLGQGPLTEGRARRIFTSPLTDSWLAVSRDICGELRDVDVEWIEFFVPETSPGNEVFLDQAYVGQGGGGAWNDLETPLAEPWHDAEQRQMRVANLAPRIGAGIVSLQFEDGRIAEGFVWDKRHIVTLGAAAPLSGSVRVVTAMGEQHDGKLLGVSREHNWALIQCPGELPAPPPRLDGAAPLPINMVMVECGVGGDGATAVLPGPLPLNRLRSFQPEQIENSPLGRPLLAAGGHVLGLRFDARRARYVSLTNLRPTFESLKNPSRMGKWQLGEGPQLGVQVRWSQDGAKVVAATQAAKAAGLQVGDRLLSVEGQPVQEAWTLHHALCERDPGQEATVTLLRGDGKPQSLQVRLGYRQ